ncbi:hypothetical protein ETD86_14665 [Nonomuraea turkmeniaca]|uniref:Uncharacterized protein n=1 Tax=Nonomuraea turkmeniaca TaxID=103838 RepID=A0A5S4FLE1_9ACTN|nr:hypothetical protein [Nonomuraea turkmeniaca]TMR21547.1 hypothetical protein ETD86_14665 [Nonomuraea turkmeniaca]
MAGGVAALALGHALWRLAPETTVYGFDRSLLGGVHLVSSVTGFAVATWVAAGTGRWWSRGAVSGVFAAVCWLAVPVEEPVHRWHLARGFELLGVPLVAPDLAGHGLYWAEAPIVGGPGEPVLMLEYRRRGAETVGGSRRAVQVLVRRGSDLTAAEACATPYNAESWEDNRSAGGCQAVSRDRWVRYGWEGRVAVFVRSGSALVELESHGVEEAALLAAAETIRLIPAEMLGRWHHMTSTVAFHRMRK